MACLFIMAITSYLIKIIPDTNFDKAVESLIEVHDFSVKQTQLMLSLYKRKIDNPEGEITMTRIEINMLETEDEEGLEESEVLFNELGIVWDKK